MFSAYLKKELNLREGVATVSGGKKKAIVYHTDLEHFIVNEMAGKISYDYPILIPSLTDAVATCSMWDETGRKITVVGEATKDTLTSHVGNAYPTTIAAQRAFDRAAIRFLDLGVNVYSNLELAPDGPKNYDNANLIDGDVADAESTVESTPVAEPVASASRPIQQPGGKSTTDSTPANAPATSQGTNDGDVIITIGKYAGKSKTLKEIYTEDLQWLQYIAENIKPKKVELMEQMEAVKRYLAAQEGN